MFKSSRWSRLFAKRNATRRTPAQRHRRQRLRCELLESRRVLATFAVNTTDDTQAVDLLTGVDANGNVSIRSAIMAANSQPGNHVINIPDSELPYLLAIGGSGENLGATGDLDVRSTIEINASPTTTLEAQFVDRVFEVQGNGNLTLNGLHLVGGLASQGGAIYNRGSLTLNDSTVEGTAGELAFTIAVTIDLTPKNAWGGAILNAATGQLSILNSVIRGTARGSNAFGSAAAPGIRGGHAYGGAIYNLGTLNTFNVQIFGDAYGGSGGDGASGANGVDSTGGQPATSGQPGFAGGAGGYAYGGSIYNGPAGTMDFTQTVISGNAWGGFGGRGGSGGNGGAASAVDQIVAGQAGVGGSGGTGGLAYGGGIYNAGGDVSFATGDIGNSQVLARAYAGSGGAGGQGGFGGRGDVDAITGQQASASNGGAGGVGGVGGVAQGGGIYTLSGLVTIAQTDLTGASTEETLGAVGGSGGVGGAGGEGGGLYALLGNGNGGTGARGGRGGTGEGGGLYVKGGTVNVRNSLLESYTARGGDAGASGSGGLTSVGIPGLTSTGATGAAGQGGAIAVRGGEVISNDSRFISNNALGGTGGASGDGLAAGMGGLAQGGAIFSGSGLLTIQTSVIDSNFAIGGSGGLADVNRVDLIGTDGGLGGNAQGGGVSITSGLAAIDQSTLMNNEAQGGAGSAGGVGDFTNAVLGSPVGGDGGRGGAAAGGGLYVTGSSLFVGNSTLHGNRVTGGLGGAAGAAQVIEGVPVGPFGLPGGNNSGRGGGAFYTGAGTYSINSVTIARNEVGDTVGSGAGIYNVGSTISVRNTLITLNTLAVGNLSNNWDAVGTFNSQGYNIISVRNGTTGFVATGDRRGLSTAPLDVQLGPLSLDFMPTAPLLFSSIAINAGDPVNSLTIDQLGRPRFGRADIGAVEFYPIQEN